MLQVSDGAALALLMTRREALRRGLPVMAVFRSFAAVGVDPAIMGVGPAVAIPKAVKMAGLTLDDIDVYEINEAFASQAMYCVNELGIPAEKVRVCCLLFAWWRSRTWHVLLARGVAMGVGARDVAADKSA